jgi:uncharacterized protein YutE (UPF0331/DUF86 family)
MSVLDLDVLAERVSAVQRHLARVEAKLPSQPADLLPSSDATDSVVLHLWLAVQIVVDLAVSLCARLNLGAHSSYGDAFRRLAQAGYLEHELGARLAKSAGFRNVIAHAYESLDLKRVHAAAVCGPADLRAFLARVRDLARGDSPIG